MKRRKWFIISLVILILIVVIFLSISLSGPISKLSGGKREIDLTILTSTFDYRINEEFNLFLDDIPDSANVSWDLGSGNFSYGNPISVVFENSNFYNVSVVAKWEGTIGRGNLILPVKNQDENNIWGGSGLRDIRITRGNGEGEFVNVYPGISTPSVYSHVIVENINGRFSIICFLFFEGEDSGEIIYEEDISGVNKDIVHEIAFPPDDLPVADRQYEISTIVHCQEGFCGPWEVSISTEY